MLRILAALLAALTLAACENAPRSKEPDAAASPSRGAADADPVASAKLRSSIELRRPAGAGSSVPARSGAYPVAVVMDLAIEARDSTNLTDAERVEFEVIKGELSQLFGASFREALQKAGYVQAIAGEGTRGAVVIRPTLTKFTAPTNRGTMGGIHTGILEISVTVQDDTGGLLGSYQLKYAAALLANRLPAMDIQRRVFPDAGSKVAHAMAKGR